MPASAGMTNYAQSLPPFPSVLPANTGDTWPAPSTHNSGTYVYLQDTPRSFLLDKSEFFYLIWGCPFREKGAGAEFGWEKTFIGLIGFKYGARK